MGIATYLAGYRSHAGVAGISLVDGGGPGSWTASGGVNVAGFGFTWSATFYDSSGGIEPPPDGGVTPPIILPPSGGGGGGTPPGTTRRCYLEIAGGTGGSWDFAVTGSSFTGQVSISIPAREICRIGSASGVDIAESYDLQNGTATAQITLLGQTVSYTTNSTTYRILPFWALRSRGVVPFAGSGSQSVSWTQAPGGCTSPSTSADSTHTSGSDWSYSVSATTAPGGPCEISVSKTILGSSGVLGPEALAEANMSCTQDRACAFSGRLNRVMASWPDSIEWRVMDSQPWQSASNGSITTSIEQKSYTVFSVCTDVSAPLSLQGDQKSAQQHQLIHPLCRFTAGGILYQQPLLLHGPRWTALALTHATTKAVDDGSTLTPTGDFAGAWSGQSGGSVASSGGAIHITGGSGKKARRTFTAPQGYTAFKGYSRLRLKLKASASNHSIVLRLGSDYTSPTSGLVYPAPRWIFQTGSADTYTEHLIDLGAETNGPGLAINGAALEGNFRWGDAYGMRQFEELGLESLGAGDYWIDSISLETAFDGSDYTAPRIHVMPLQGLPHMGIRAVADGSEVYNFLTSPFMSIATAVGFMNTASDPRYISGWSATDASPPGSPGAEPWPASELTTGRVDLRFLGGGGLLWDGTDQSWSLPFDYGGGGETGATTGSLTAQWLVSTMQWDWPTTLLGFLTLDEASGIYHAGGGMWEGVSAWGRVLSSADGSAPVGRDGVSGASVKLQKLDGTLLAETTTDSEGWFLLPATASETYSARILIAGRNITASLGSWRGRVVAIEQAPPDGTLLAMAVSATGRIVRGYKNPSSALLLEFYQRPDSWEQVDTGLSLSGGGSLCYDKAGHLQRLWLAYDDSGAIKSRYTDDEGAGFSVATTIFSAGSNPALVISPTQVRHYFCVDGGAIKTKALDTQGGEVIAESTVVSSGVASAPIDAAHDGKELLLTYKNPSGQVITVKSADGGKTFT